MGEISAGQLRAARGLLGWSQTDLAEAAKVGRATIADFESGKREPYPRTIGELRAALEAAGIVFTNGGEPGVRRITAVAALHSLADRSGLDVALRNAGHENWNIVPSPLGLDCQNQSGDILGYVRAGSLETPEPQFDPPIGNLTFPDRATPSELRAWIIEMSRRNALS